MSHELDIRNGKAAFAYIGEDAWHGLGQKLTDDASIEVWKTEAGMNWEVKSSPMHTIIDGEVHKVNDRVLLTRSDTKDQLGIVSEEYKVVQPGQVLEFFDELTRLHGMKLSTAGVLFGGKRFWALANTGTSTEPLMGDEIQSNLLLVTSADGTMSTQARYCSTRVVCANTMSIALSENAKNIVKVTHRKEWNPKEVQINLGLISKSWSTYTEQLKALTKIKVDEKKAREIYESIYYKELDPGEEQSLNARRTVASLMERCFAGIGSDWHEGTAYGVLNGATEFFTHGTGRRDPSQQFWSAHMGPNNVEKTKVFEKLLELV